MWHPIRFSLSFVAAVLFACGTAHAAQGTGARGSGRLLVVDVDDVGFDLLADAPTPTLDWMASQGRAFTSFTTAPICSPGRAMALMGAYPSHPGVLLGRTVPARSTYSFTPTALQTLPEVLSAAGISNGKVGKWHLSGARDLDHPIRMGWQSYTGVMSNLGGTNDSYSDFQKVTGGVLSRRTGRYLTSDETDDAIELVRAGTRYVSLSYHAPHAPFETPPPWLHSVSPIVDDRDRARAMLQACDRELGRLLREALALGYTVIVFSDNGTPQPIGGGKGTLFDTGIVTPMFAVGPGVVPGTDDARVGVVDLYATVLDFFQVQVNPTTCGPQSRSFLPALGGNPGDRRWTYSEAFPLLGDDPRIGSALWKRAVRGERFKLIRMQNGSGESLFDLANDPAEAFDLLQGPGLSPQAAAALAYFQLVMDRL